MYSTHTFSSITAYKQLHNGFIVVMGVPVLSGVLARQTTRGSHTHTLTKKHSLPA